MSDTISRQAAIDALDGEIEITGRTNVEAVKGYVRLVKDRLERLPSAQSDNRLSKIAELVDGTIDHFDLDDAMDLLYQIKQVLDGSDDLPSAQPEQRWIPVSERLPEPRVDVWVNSDIGQIRGYYEEHVGVWYASFGQGRDYLELIVNAWMPLPEPYREERTEE